MITEVERLFCTSPSSKSQVKYAMLSFGSLSFVAEASKVTTNGENQLFSPTTLRSQSTSSRPMVILIDSS